jgi:rod shape-determining protein MreD
VQGVRADLILLGYLLVLPLLLAPVLEVVLWPLLDRMLLAPQRRAPDRDVTRPL